MIGPQAPVLLVPAPFSPYRLGDNAARYSFEGLASDMTYIVDAANRLQLVADRSGNSALNGLVLNGATGNYASTPDSAAVSVTGSIDFVVRVGLQTMPPSAFTGLIVRDDAGSSTNSYRLYVRSGDGFLTLGLSASGGAFTDVNSGVIIPFTQGWVRATWNSVSKTVQFFTCSDQASVPAGGLWVQLGTDKTISIAGIFDAAISLELGSRASGAQWNLAGTIYRAQIYNGIAGTLAFDANFTLPAKLAASFTESSVNAATVTINTSGDLGARICGARDIVQLTQAKQPIYLPWQGANYGYLPGLSGANFTTPTNVNINIGAGAIDIRAHIIARSTVAGTSQVIYDTASSSTGFNFLFTSGSVLRAGTQSWGVNSSAHGLTTGDFWVRVTSSASGGTVSFYKSSDGITWTALGTATDGGRTASGVNVAVGSGRDGSTPSTFGLVYLDVRNTVANDGSGIVAMINPLQYTSGATLVASTGETWTLNGGTMIVTQTCGYSDGSNDYLTSSFPLVQPEQVYLVGGQVAWSSGVDVMDGGAVNGMILQQHTGTPKLVQYAGSFSSDNSDLVLQKKALITALYSNAASSLAINRNAAITGTTGTSNANGFTIGARADGSLPSNVVFSEILIRSVADDAGTQAKIQNFLISKWGIAA